MKIVSALKITLTKSLIGQRKDRIATVESFGLRKINKTTIQPDNDATRGKIRKVRDLVTVEDIDDAECLA